MDAGYDAAPSSHGAGRPDEDRRRDRGGDRDRVGDRDRGDRRHGSGRDDRDRGERDHRDRGDRDGGHRDRERYESRGGGRSYDHDDRGDHSRRRRREDEGVAEPMGGHRDRRPRREEDAYAAPMRGYSPPPRRDDRDRGPPGGEWRPPRDSRGPPGGFRGGRGGGGGGGGGGYRDGGRGGGRDGGRDGGRGRTPPRSPTPDGVVPLEARKIEHSLWDIRPMQFEGIGAMAAKMTGMFTYGPGRIPPPAHLMVPEQLIVGSFPPSGASVAPLSSIRQAKRLYIGGFTEAMKDEDLLKFFNDLMKEKELANKDEEGDAITEASVNAEKAFAFLEFRNAEEATAAMALDGVVWEGTPLRVRRPKDFVGIDPELGPLPGMVGTNVTDSPDKLFIGAIPTYLNDEQVMELLKSFGELKNFNLVKEAAANGGGSKGFAFAEYEDTETTDLAIAGLNNFELGDKVLVVQRANVGKSTGIPDEVLGSIGYLSGSNNFESGTAEVAPTSRVMLLLNMVTPEELYDDQDYADILEDIQEECSKYGEIEGVRVPRPIAIPTIWMPQDEMYRVKEANRKKDDEAGVGRVYVLYKEIESTAKAMKAIGGRQFAGRTILVACVAEEEFNVGPSKPPPPPPIEGAAEGEGAEEDMKIEPDTEAEPAPPPPPPQSIDDAAADALKDIMG